MSKKDARKSFAQPHWEEWIRAAHFSPALRVGRTLYLSGHTGVPDADIETQIRQAYEDVAGTLRLAGASWADVVSITSYHVGFNEQREALRRVHNEFVREPYPAWSAVGVAELVDGLAIEISVIAELPE